MIAASSTFALLAAVVVLTGAQRDRIDSLVRYVAMERGLSALSVGIARTGTPLYLRAEHVAYPLGSIAKQFTAALVLQDAQAGRLSLAQPWSDTTVESLLAQTARGGWNYDNANYVALRTMVERTDGRDFCSLVRARIAMPLGLHSLRCDPTDPLLGAIGLSGNVDDLLVWLEALRDGRVMAPAWFAKMTTSAVLSDGTPVHYGYGFFINDWYGASVAEHPGYVPGYSAADALVLDDGLELVALGRGGTVDLVALLKSLAAIVDPARDPNLVARLDSPPQNENRAVTQALRALAEEGSFGSLGTLQGIDFVERLASGANTVDRYRLTFATGPQWVDVRYGRDATIESLQFTVAR